VTFDPKAGDMVRYDFLWDHEHRKGQTEGTKDRFCFVVIATKPQEDGSNRLLLAPITHTPPSSDDRAIDMPPKLGRSVVTSASMMIALGSRRTLPTPSPVRRIACQLASCQPIAGSGYMGSYRNQCVRILSSV